MRNVFLSVKPPGCRSNETIKLVNCIKLKPSSGYLSDRTLELTAEIPGTNPSLGTLLKLFQI